MGNRITTPSSRPIALFAPENRPGAKTYFLFRLPVKPFLNPQWDAFIKKSGEKIPREEITKYQKIRNLFLLISQLHPGRAHLGMKEMVSVLKMFEKQTAFPFLPGKNAEEKGKNLFLAVRRMVDVVMPVLQWQQPTYPQFVKNVRTVIGWHDAKATTHPYFEDPRGRINPKISVAQMGQDPNTPSWIREQIPFSPKTVGWEGKALLAGLGLTDPNTNPLSPHETDEIAGTAHYLGWKKGMLGEGVRVHPFSLPGGSHGISPQEIAKALKYLSPRERSEIRRLIREKEGELMKAHRFGQKTGVTTATLSFLARLAIDYLRKTKTPLSSALMRSTLVGFVFYGLGVVAARDPKHFIIMSGSLMGLHTLINLYFSSADFTHLFRKRCGNILPTRETHRLFQQQVHTLLRNQNLFQRMARSAYNAIPMTLAGLFGLGTHVVTSSYFPEEHSLNNPLLHMGSGVAAYVGLRGKMASPFLFIDPSTLLGAVTCIPPAQARATGPASSPAPESISQLAVATAGLAVLTVALLLFPGDGPVGEIAAGTATARSAAQLYTRILQTIRSQRLVPAH